jgi:hypothetical protein
MKREQKYPVATEPCRKSLSHVLLLVIDGFAFIMRVKVARSQTMKHRSVTARKKIVFLCWQLWLVAALKGNALAQLALGEAHAVGESGATLDEDRAIVLLEVMILSSVSSHSTRCPKNPVVGKNTSCLLVLMLMLMLMHTQLSVG